MEVAVPNCFLSHFGFNTIISPKVEFKLEEKFMTLTKLFFNDICCFYQLGWFVKRDK